MRRGTEFSELEYLILAMLGSGYNSGYAMRKQMSRMPGGRWSAQSGSVYRVIRRLEAEGLLETVRTAGVPNRERTEYELTTAGRIVANNWLTAAPPREDFGFMVDPIRTRSYFLGLLDPKARLSSVRTWMRENKTLIASLEREVEKGAAVTSVLAFIPADNLLRLAKARQEWLRATVVGLEAGSKAS